MKVCHIFASVLKNKVGSSVGSSLKLLVIYVLLVSKMLTDNPFFRRLNTITSADVAVANGVLYQNQSWVIAKKKAKPKSSKPEDQYNAFSGTELI